MKYVGCWLLLNFLEQFNVHKCYFNIVLFFTTIKVGENVKLYLLKCKYNIIIYHIVVMGNVKVNVSDSEKNTLGCLVVKMRACCTRGPRFDPEWRT